MPDTTDQHADRVRVNGYTVFDDALPRALVDEMRGAFDALLEQHRRDHPTNRGANRYQMYVPFEPPFADPCLYANDVVMPVVRAVLGADAVCVYFASDTPFPGSDYQRVHSDTRLLFPDERLSLPPYGVVLNVPLVDVTEENGPMECWPGGTHLWTGAGDLPSLADDLPSVRLTMPAGAALLRDLRMWHRGTPNHGARSRPNLALVYTRPWYRFEQQPPSIPADRWERLPDGARALFRFANITQPVERRKVPKKVEPPEPAPTLIGAKPPDPEEAIRERILGLSDSSEAWQTVAREALAALPRNQVLAAARGLLWPFMPYHQFVAIARWLAELGGEDAIELLVAQSARPGMALPALNALGESADPAAATALLHLLRAGTHAQRTAAVRALAQCDTLDAVTALGRTAADPHDPVAAEARIVLREMGRPDELARRILAHADARPADHALALAALAAATHLNAPRFLDREARNPHSPVARRAEAAAALLRNQTTLLRSADADTSTLLTPAHNPTADTAALLRTANPPDT